MRSIMLIGCLLLVGPASAQWDESKPTPAGAIPNLPKPTVNEDAAQAFRPAKAEKDRANDERIKELIFQLRDQRASQWGFPGCCDIFCVINQAGVAVDTPALNLAAFEYAAVPHLLAALDDKRLTQAVGKRGKWRMEEYTLRVGDCAYIILERIAAGRFAPDAGLLTGSRRDKTGGAPEEAPCLKKSSFRAEPTNGSTTPGDRSDSMLQMTLSTP